METIPTPLLILGAFAAVMLFWFGVVWFIAQLAGWPKLAEKYPARQPWNEKCWSMQSAVIRRARYNGVLRVCADTEGLHLSVIFPFSVSQPPLFIPWIEIIGHQKRLYLFYGVELRFQQAPTVPLQISRTLADRLVAASAGAWVYEQTT